MKENKLPLQEAFVKGSSGQCTTDLNDGSRPLVIRGVTSKTEVNICQENNRDFYYVPDTLEIFLA